MASVLRVSLRPALPPVSAAAGVAAPRTLLSATGPRACLGGSLGPDHLAIPVRPGPATLFGPRGACLVQPQGPLWVCDTGHHRLLGWDRCPDADHTPADWLIGQPDFAREGRNAKGPVSAHSFNVPTGITACGPGLAVADAWNHRVMIWRSLPQDHHVPSDVVLGQANFHEAEPNRGRAQPAADSLYWPYGVHWDGHCLWVADTGNRRVLMWRGLPDTSGQPADLVLGQRSFDCRDENAGHGPDAVGMRWPHAVTRWNEALCVTDAGNNRVMVWHRLPWQDGAACDFVLGQSAFDQADHNQSRYLPTATSLHMPYGMAAAGDWCVVADTANSRLLGWHASADLGHAAPAQALTGQRGFQAKGDNAWQLPSRDSLCWPYAIGVSGELAVVADSGNNRVLLWPLDVAPRP